MKETYAPNAIVIGVLFGIVVTLKTNMILGILVGLAISILGWILIRAFEDTVERAVDKAGNAIEDTIRKKWNERKKK